MIVSRAVCPGGVGCRTIRRSSAETLDPQMQAALGTLLRGWNKQKPGELICAIAICLQSRNPLPPPIAAVMSISLLEQLQNPSNVVLLVVFLYLLYPIVFSASSDPSKPATSHLESYSWMPEHHPESIIWKEYTPRSLRQYDGTASSNAPILFAIRGKVYDVSTGRSFYGPGGPYGESFTPKQFFFLRLYSIGNFAGRDASRGLAKQSFEMVTAVYTTTCVGYLRYLYVQDMLTPIDVPIDDLSDLSPSEWGNLKEW